MSPYVEKNRSEAESELYYHHFLFQTFRSIMKRMTSTTSFTKVVDIITEDVAKFLGVKGSALMLLDRKEKTLVTVSFFGLSESYLAKGPVHADKSIGEGMDGLSVCVDDVANDPRIEYPEAALLEGIRSILSVPISFRGQVIGLLRLYTTVPTEFRYEDIEFVEGLADLAGLVIEYGRLVSGFKTSLEALKKLRQDEKN